MKKLLLFLTAIFNLINLSFCQDLQEKTEALSNTSNPESYSDSYLIFMEELVNNPIDISDADWQDLQQLNMLSDFQINNLLQHIRKFGPLLSIHELQTIEGFDYHTIINLAPYVKISNTSQKKQPFLKRYLENKNHFLVLRYDTRVLSKKDKALYSQSGYEGSPFRLSGRYRNFSPGDFSLGLSFENDAGEKFLWNPRINQYGFDYLSWHFSLYNRNRFRNITIGDFSMQAGQGLVWGSTFSLGKGSETITAIRKNSGGIRPYNSLTEYGYYKGISATADITRRISVIGVYSRKTLDARVTGDSIISFAETGYHRDSAENLLRKNAVEQVAGGSIRYQTRDSRFRSGINFCGINYNKTIAGNEDTYRIFNFSGQSAFYTGADYSYTFRNVSISGETASSSDGSLATIHGLIIALSPRIDYAISYRRFSKSYDNPYASGFGENTRTSNESGIYQGIKFSPSRSVEVSGYADIFRFPWLKYQIDAPTRGAEYMIRGIYRFSRKTNIYLQFREEIREKTYVSDASDLYRKQTFAFNFTGSFEPFTINSRFIWNQTASPLSKGTGTAVSNDLSLKTGKLETTLRFAVFDTRTYDNRLYVYEKDVLYSFSIPAYYGTGCRYYILTRLRIFRKTDLWLRYSKTVDLGQEKIGEEKPENQTGKGGELKIQIKYTF